ncbi:MAG: acetyl-CoA carboxylase biotin carboxyl carrier protein [Candidatus Zixiibacteriota bacterium]|nr:MAG: acetyl-CoA carboxylase biotin carboxyl carrier protein [candidate division Zixibacteria bacterium]
MNEKYIKKLIRLVEESDIESLEVSSWGRKVRITQRLSASSNGSGDSPAVLQPIVTATSTTTSEPAPPAVVPPTPAEAPPVEDTGRQVAVKSPMVGTFYAAPSPEANPYVSLNEKITVGQVVCIVEAMKLMNEIESEVSGRVAKILVENAQPVEFGQELFLIDPAG